MRGPLRCADRSFVGRPCLVLPSATTAYLLNLQEASASLGCARCNAHATCTLLAACWAASSSQRLPFELVRGHPPESIQGFHRKHHSTAAGQRSLQQPGRTTQQRQQGCCSRCWQLLAWHACRCAALQRAAGGQRMKHSASDSPLQRTRQGTGSVLCAPTSMCSFSSAQASSGILPYVCASPNGKPRPATVLRFMPCFCNTNSHSSFLQRGVLADEQAGQEKTAEEVGPPYLECHCWEEVGMWAERL